MTDLHTPRVALSGAHRALLLDLLADHPDLVRALREAPTDDLNAAHVHLGTYQQMMEAVRATPYATLLRQTETHLAAGAHALLHSLGVLPDAAAGPGRTVFVDYSATGEGRHIWWLWTPEEDPDAARAAFQRRFFPDDQAWTYFRLGLRDIPGRYPLPGMTAADITRGEYESHVNFS